MHQSMTFNWAVSGGREGGVGASVGWAGGSARFCPWRPQR